MNKTGSSSSARDRLLLAGAHLLDQSGGGEVSTRAICELAGVQAPTLYHHFGSKQGLLDAVVSHGFRQFLTVRRSFGDSGGDSIADVREGWDRHVLFGLQHPNFYAHVYGAVRPGQPCGVVAEVEAMLLEALQPAARQGLLAVPPEDAAKQILAASTGVILTLIQQPGEERDLRLSHEVREAVLGRIAPSTERAEVVSTVAASAVALRARLEQDGSPLNEAETALLQSWLHQLGTASAAKR